MCTKPPPHPCRKLDSQGLRNKQDYHPVSQFRRHQISANYHQPGPIAQIMAFLFYACAYGCAGCLMQATLIARLSRVLGDCWRSAVPCLFERDVRLLCRWQSFFSQVKHTSGTLEWQLRGSQYDCAHPPWILIHSWVAGWRPS